MSANTSTGIATGTATEPKASSRTLYEISTDYFDFEQLINSIDLAEVTTDEQEQIDAFIKDLVKERDKKFENCGGLIKDWELIGKAQVEEGERIKSLGNTKINKAKYLKGRLLGFFQFHQIDKPIETERFKFRRCSNGGLAPVKLSARAESNPVELPEQYRRVVYEPNLDKIREDLVRRDEIVKTFDALKVIGRMETMAAVAKLQGALPTTEEQAEYDALVVTVKGLGKTFIDKITQYGPEDLLELEVAKTDLDALLDGVGELGARGEHLRIS